MKQTKSILESYDPRLTQARDGTAQGSSTRLSFRATKVKVITHWQELIHTSRANLLTLNGTINESMILGIVDQTGRSSAQIQQINAELHKYGERTPGVHTVCITLQSLQRLMKENQDNSLYFPGNMLRKMNFMSGVLISSLQHSSKT